MEKLVFSEGYRDSYPHLGFGLATVEGFNKKTSYSRVVDAKEACVQRLAGNHGTVLDNIGKYEKFFKANGFNCPLRKQFQATLRKGLPTINPFVDALLAGEMSMGVMMGVQDADKVSWPLVLDIASEEEPFEGLRGPILCRAGEIVIRDPRGIVASYFQGPDSRTSVTGDTSSLLVYGFLAPGVTRDIVEKALAWVCRLFDPEGRGTQSSVLTP